MNRVLKCDGYEMFHGSFVVNRSIRVSGDWLHVPAWKNSGCDVWYVRPDDGGMTVSYPASVLSEMEMEE